MNSIQDQLFQELRNTPPGLFQQILDFVRFLKQQHTQTLPLDSPTPIVPLEDDPIVGLYSGSPDLSERAEEILVADIQEYSGWTWKS